jgi:1,4-dihydroxy-2-naphthoate octaprenyltransferase
MMVLIGLLIPGMGFLVTNGQLSLDGLLFSIPVMLYGMAFTLAIEIPDMESDRLGGKRSWVAQFGRRFGFRMIAAALFLASLFFFAFPLLTSRSYTVDFQFMGMISVLPLATSIVWLLKRPDEKRLAMRASSWIIVTYIIFFLIAVAYMLSLALVRVL